MTATVAMDFSSDFGAPAAPAPTSSSKVESSSGDAPVLVIGSQEAAQAGTYQAAVQKATQDGSKKVEMHLVDRISDGVTSLPESSYAYIHVLVPLASLTSTLFATFLASLRPQGSLDLELAGSAVDEGSTRKAKGELTVAGFVRSEIIEVSGSSVIRGYKPEYSSTNGASSSGAPLSFALKKKGTGSKKASLWTTSPATSANGNGLIDSDSLLSASDRLVPTATRRADCPPAEDGGPRRKKACKGCTCGLRELEEAETNGTVVQLDDMDSDLPAGSSPGGKRSETIETTVSPDGTVKTVKKIQVDTKGATSSCGSCFLGDAFRCSSCPFLGMPAFEPGQKVEIPSSMDDDL